MDFPLLLRDPEKKARGLVRKITHSGEDDLNKELLTELRKICKIIGDSIVKSVYDECTKCLRKDHSQVRVSTVRLIDYIFKKSHSFRSRILEDFDLFLNLTLGLNADSSKQKRARLPPPKRYAALLQELTAKVINIWHSDFGKGYEKLRYAYKYLKEHQLVDFSSFQVRSREDLINRQKLIERQEKILTLSIENRLKELHQIKPETEQLLAKIESLIDLIIAPATEFSDDSFNSEPDAQDNRRQHGIANLSQNLEIQFDPYLEIEHTSSNRDIVQDLKELKKELVEGKMAKLVAIEKTLAKRGDQFVPTLRDIISLKSKAMNIVMKLGELKVVYETEKGDKKKSTLDSLNSDTEEESDFEEVAQKDDLETYIPKSLRKDYGLEAIDPRECQSTSTMLTEESFDSGIVAGPSSGLNHATTVLTCNVRLDSGKLCPRRDKIKCPFHGRIIPRDHRGDPLNEEDRLEEEKKSADRKRNIPEWQDPELLADLRAATGVDLTMPARGKPQVSRPKLVNAKTCDVTPKQRLQKRLKMLSNR